MIITQAHQEGVIAAGISVQRQAEDLTKSIPDLPGPGLPSATTTLVLVHALARALVAQAEEFAPYSFDGELARLVNLLGPCLRHALNAATLEAQARAER